MNKQKIIVIGDIHGEEIWKNIVEKYPTCKYIFLGDYCDPYNVIHEDDVIANLQKIIENFEFTKTYRQEVAPILQDVPYIERRSDFPSTMV